MKFINFFGNGKLRSYFEVFLISTVSIAIGWYINREDPLLLQKHFSYYLLLLSIISLYYGFGTAILCMTIFAVSLLIFYETFPYEIFSMYLLMAFILSEFHYYWKRKLQEYDEVNDYLKEKLEETATNLFILKTSHDQLEKNYILKPLSIRETLKEIKEMLYENEKNYFEEFLKLTGRVCGIESASLYIKDKEGNFNPVSTLGKENIPFHINDPLLKSALEEKSTAYFTVAHAMKNTEYIAVIPAVTSQNSVKGILLVKEIPFLNLNKDNLLTISLFLSYFINTYETARDYSYLNKKFPTIPEVFIKELDKIVALKNRFKTQSSIVIFAYENNSMGELIAANIEKSLRGIDTLYTSINSNRYKVVVLLPLTPNIGAMEFIKRIRRNISSDFGKEYEENISSTLLTLIDKDIENILAKMESVK
ncbi:PelD GGDEF domain-containing protein [Nitrosophilus alvini]|uniref:PelD GGDEF domain-containing protein n=1 Tax=Nitrosophilus alvini TaxID=2714855 RepID=UPI00190C1667|nr:PelD GGDEF domain-containing protein [Nitrosophilus alvini]